MWPQGLPLEQCSSRFQRMKEALVSIDPMAIKGKGFKRFCEKIRLFQEQGFISRTSVASVIHSSLYLMPYDYYRISKDGLAKEARLNVDRACRGQFQYNTVRVLQSDSSANEELVANLSRYGKLMGSDILVLGSNDRKGLPYWILGSLSETASLSASMPVLIFKTSTSISPRSRAPRLVCAVDVAAPPSARHITWIANLARSTKADLDLVYVDPRPRAMLSSLQQRKSKGDAQRILRSQVVAFKSKGAGSVTSTILSEGRSIAHTMAEFSEKQSAWLTITTTPKRTKIRRLLLGSNARHILALTRRPFLSLRGE